MIWSHIYITRNYTNSSTLSSTTTISAFGSNGYSGWRHLYPIYWYAGSSWYSSASNRVVHEHGQPIPTHKPTKTCHKCKQKVFDVWKENPVGDFVKADDGMCEMCVREYSAWRANEERLILLREKSIVPVKAKRRVEPHIIQTGDLHGRRW